MLIIPSIKELTHLNMLACKFIPHLYSTFNINDALRKYEL